MKMLDGNGIGRFRQWLGKVEEYSLLWQATFVFGLSGFLARESLGAVTVSWWLFGAAWVTFMLDVFLSMRRISQELAEADDIRHSRLMQGDYDVPVGHSATVHQYATGHVVEIRRELA